MNVNKSLGWFGRAYEGQAKLWKVFWLGYALPIFPVVIATNIAKELSAKSPSSWVPFTIFIVIWVYYVWVAIFLWRCAPNSKGRVYLFLGRALGNSARHSHLVWSASHFPSTSLTSHSRNDAPMMLPFHVNC